MLLIISSMVGAIVSKKVNILLSLNIVITQLIVSFGNPGTGIPKV